MQWRLLLACILEQRRIIKLITGSDFEESEGKMLHWDSMMDNSFISLFSLSIEIKYEFS